MAAGVAAGEPVGRHQDQGNQAVRAIAGDRRHHGSEKLVRLAQLNGVGLRQSCAGGEVRPDPASALCPCQAVQARQPDAEEAAHLSRPRHPRHRPQDRGRRRARRGRSQSCYCWRAACANRNSINAGGRSIPCMRRKSNASAKAKLIGLTSSASRSALPPPSNTARAASSSPM